MTSMIALVQFAALFTAVVITSICLISTVWIPPEDH